MIDQCLPGLIDILQRFVGERTATPRTCATIVSASLPKRLHTRSAKYTDIAGTRIRLSNGWSAHAGNMTVAYLVCAKIRS
jgi:hypothetical protein